MNSRQTNQRYFGGIIAATFVLVAGSLGISWLGNNTDTPRMLLGVLSVVPIAALLSMFWVHWRYLRELDEYLRQLHVQALLFAAAITLGVGTGWGYLEIAIDVPALAVYWLNPLYWIVYSVAVVFLSARDAADRT